jgi:glycosyltransferase involved in cell wall biosynthesis
MRALLDFTQVPVDRTGVGVYADNLLREMVDQIPPGDELFVLVQEDEQRAREILRGRANVVLLRLPLRLFRNRALLLLFEQLWLPILLLCKRIDVMHSLHYTHPLLSPCPRVVTIHDLTFLLFPELHTFARKLVMPFFIHRAIKNAQGLIFISEATRNDAYKLATTPLRPLCRVIPHGVHPEEFNATALNVSEKVLQKFSLIAPFILFVGTIEPRKNLLRLIDSFDRISREYPQLLLVIAGKAGWNFEEIFVAIRESVNRGKIRYLGFVSDPEKKVLLSRCEVLIYPSLYEGFGLPVLEAMASGAPVITSNISSLPEVAGDAAFLVNPNSTEEMVDALRMILASADLRRALAAAGRCRAAEFSWRRTAQLTFDFYRTVATSGDDHSKLNG